MGGFAGAVLGARGGPIGAGIGAFLGGSTGYAVGYALSELEGSRGEPHETTLDDYATDAGAADAPGDDSRDDLGDEGPVRIEVDEADDEAGSEADDGD